MRSRRFGFLFASSLAVLAAACAPGAAPNADAPPKKPDDGSTSRSAPSNSSTPTTPASTSSSPSPSRTGADGLAAAVGKLKVAAESRAGYEREKFELWVDADDNGCDTRKEVLIAEATSKPRRGEECRLTRGKWRSYYDGKSVTDDGDLDIDHMVPLAEAWDSGASKWSPSKRERYANDLDAERSLVAVTLGTNRSKGDQDPVEWLPPAKSELCTYAVDWVSTKQRWKLTVDQTEHTKLKRLAADCPDAVVDVEPAP